MRDALARELLGVCMDALQTYGLERTRLLELVREVAGESRRTTPRTTQVLKDMYWMGELISDWAENPVYLDGEGRPEVIEIKGQGATLNVLVKKFFGTSRPVEEILKLGCETKVLERVGESKVALFNACVMFTGNPMLMMAHSVRSMRRFFKSATFNAYGSVDPASIWPERTAFTTVPEDDFPEFIQVMRHQIASLLEMSNRWLSHRASIKHAKSRKKVTMGVQAFVFRE